jgi:hypothetical protein
VVVLSAIVMPSGISPNDLQAYHTLLSMVCGCSCPFFLILFFRLIRSWSKR